MSDIENLISECEVSNKFATSKQKNSFINHDIPDIPFYKIGADIAGNAVNSFLVAVDYCIRPIEINKLRKKDSTEIIKKIKLFFQYLEFQLH